MHITKIELEDIKSHADSKFEFLPGTTAITGENGAGKTTLIEAVAWTLFDLLDYKKEDLVRRGAKKGIARVTFESGLDEREYTVYRDTATGYYVFDPRLKTRIADKKDEVTRFLWQHLGLEAGTDLESLFRRAIGVPQGTFTAIFLETATERKKAFDRLLKVEEYRQSAEKLRETSNHVHGLICSVREKIARSEGELAQFERVESGYNELAARADALSAELNSITADIEKSAALIAGFDEKEKKVNELRVSVERLTAARSKNELILQQHETALEQARKAAEIVETVRADSERHVNAMARIRELERERLTREKLRIELAKAEAAIVAVKADHKHLQEDLDNLLKTHTAIAGLEKLVEQQEALEKEVDSLRTELANVRSTENLIKSLEQKIGRLRESYRENQAEIARLTQKSKAGGDLETLQKTDANLLTRLGELRATLEHDEKFQGKVKNGLCPILSEKCLNLKDGETLEGFITSQFGELKGQIATLEIEHKEVNARLTSAREAEKFSAALQTLRNRETEIGEDGKRLTDERDALQKGLADIGEIEAKFKSAEARLAALENPKARIRLLQNEARREPELREQLSKIERNLERLESERRILVEGLEMYRDLDSNWSEAIQLRDGTADSRQLFVVNEGPARSLPERITAFESVRELLATLVTELESVEKEFEAARRSYDPEQHILEKTEYLAAEKRKSELTATLSAVANRRDEMRSELDRLKQLRDALAGEFKQRERLEKVFEATAFIRDTLKEAAPRVARNYVFLVSAEANQLFREISGNGERTLRWGEDYGITLEEGGYERPFISLSGGEQMAAALSVRLALLKQLSDIRIAFFDEPTTNMDAERRENLAIQISQIKHFDQLFVISHDDAFEGYVDNVVQVANR